MVVLVAFAVTLLAAVLVSAYAQRSVLSTAVMFLAAGFLLGAFDVGGALEDTETVRIIAELALFSVLFTDGMRIGARQVANAWRLPGRALLFGMPLTLLGTAALAMALTELGWLESLLLGAALAPTDPVFASALLGREEINPRLRNLLNVESGVNDGLALPVVILLLTLAGGEGEVTAAITEVPLGIAIGVAVPWLAIKLEGLSYLKASTPYEPLGGFAIGVLVLALSLASHANLFLAAFAAGMTVATMSDVTVQRFHQFGELVTELLKLGALLLFGLVIDPTFLAEIPLPGYIFALLALILVRPTALTIALTGDDLPRYDKAAAAWFGPKGFASVVYGLLILESGIESADRLYHLIAIVVAASIVAHSSTDALVARKLHEVSERAKRTA